MAIINCPECGKEVSDKASACPNCGFGVAQYVDRQEKINILRNEAEKEAYECVLRAKKLEKEEQRIRQEKLKQEEEKRKAELERQKHEAELAEEKRKKTEEIKRKVKKCIPYACIIFAIAMVVYICVAFVYPAIMFNKAQTKIKEKDYVTAVDYLDKIDNKHKKAKKELKECRYQLAKMYLEEEKFEDALDVLSKISKYKDAYTLKKEGTKGKNYVDALEFAEKKSFEEALNLLRQNKDYKDSISLIEKYLPEITSKYYEKGQYEDIIKYCESLQVYCEDYYASNYDIGISLMNKGEYQEAIGYFEKSGNEYKDSKTKIQECNNTIIYDEAVSNMKLGWTQEAIASFINLNGFKNSNQYLTWCQSVLPYLSEWQGVKYIIYGIDETHDLSHSASREKLKIRALISTDGSIKYTVNGSTATLKGNVFSYTKYSDDKSTFNFATGEQTTIYFNGEKYYYKFKKIK